MQGCYDVRDLLNFRRTGIKCRREGIKLNKLFFTIVFLLSCYVEILAQDVKNQLKKISKDEQEVIKLERLWLNAYEQRDALAMERIVADEMTITYPNGVVQRKPQIMSYLTAQKNNSNPAPKFTTFDVESRRFGNIVILNGRLITERNRNGQIVRERSRYTDVYLKKNGRWQVIASHLSDEID